MLGETLIILNKFISYVWPIDFAFVGQLDDLPANMKHCPNASLLLAHRLQPAKLQ